MRAKSHDIQWPVTAKTLENINTNFDALFESLNTFEKSVASSKNLHELLSDTHSDTIKANRLRGDLIIAQGAVPEWARLAKGTLAYVLTMGANEPAWASPNHAVLSAIHTDALAAAVVRGDVMIGNATPNWSRLAKGTATYVLTAGASDVSWATPNHALLSGTHTDALAAAVIRGDVLIGNATPNWSRLAKGTSGFVLTAGASDVSWATPNHNLLSAIHADSTTASAVRGDLIVAQGVSPLWTRLAKGTAAHVLTMGADEPAWAVIPTQTSALLSAVHTDTTPAAVVRGDVVIGSGASPTWSRLAAGTAGYLLTMGANEPAWSAPSAVGHVMLSATHTDSTPAAAVRGDLISAQGASPLWARLAAGTAGYFLKMGANEPVWAVHGLTYSDVGAAPTDHSILSATHGDSTAAAVVRGDVIIGSGATPKWTRLAKGTAGYVLTMGAEEPAWATPAAPAAHQLDGALHTVSGLTPGHFLKALTATTFGFAAHGLAYGDVGAAAASHAHAWSDITSGVPTTWTPIAHDILSAYHGDSTAAAVVRGDLIIGSGATPKWTRLAIGTAGYLLKAGANEPAWGTLASTDLSDTANLVRLGAANSFTLINPLTTLAESWIGPSSTAGIYFKDGNVSIGTTISNTLVTLAKNAGISLDTLVTADDGVLALFGCGGADSSRGASIILYGVNHATSPGDLRLTAANAPGMIKLVTAGQDRVIVLNDGKFALGSSLPYANFHVAQNVGTTAPSTTFHAAGPWALEVSGVELVGGVAPDSPFPYWLQARHVSNSPWGIALNPVGGNVGVGTVTAAAKVAINGGLHVGGDSDPGDNNLLVDGGAQISALGAFAAGDKYVVVDASGNLHVSALGPAS